MSNAVLSNVARPELPAAPASNRIAAALAAWFARVSERPSLISTFPKA